MKKNLQMALAMSATLLVGGVISAAAKKEEKFDPITVLSKIPDMVVIGVQAAALNKEIKGLKNILQGDLAVLNKAADNKKIVPAVALLEDTIRPLMKLANLLNETMNLLRVMGFPGSGAANESTLKLKGLVTMVNETLVVLRESILAQQEAALAQKEGRPAQIAPIQQVALPVDLDIEL